MLINLCGEYINKDFEKYKSELKGKAECFRIAGKRSTGTLRWKKRKLITTVKTNDIKTGINDY